MDNGKFNYTYSAPSEEEKMEIESVRRQYESAVEKEDALSRMRALNKKVRRPAEVSAWVIGVAGTLVMGTGMSISMGAVAGGMLLGCIIGFAGIAVMICNYFIYKAVLKAQKKKYGDEILKLTDGLLNGKE